MTDREKWKRCFSALCGHERRCMQPDNCKLVESDPSGAIYRTTADRLTSKIRQELYADELEAQLDRAFEDALNDDDEPIGLKHGRAM